MAKFLRVTMPDGSKFDVPADLVARDRAAYFAKADTGADSGPEYEKVFASEYEYTMNDDSELKDWAANNMNWSDVEAHAAIVWPHPDDVDYQEGWVNGEKDIIDKEHIG